MKEGFRLARLGWWWSVFEARTGLGAHSFDTGLELVRYFCGAFPGFFLHQVVVQV